MKTFGDLMLGRRGEAPLAPPYGHSRFEKTMALDVAPASVDSVAKAGLGSKT